MLVICNNNTPFTVLNELSIEHPLRHRSQSGHNALQWTTLLRLAAEAAGAVVAHVQSGCGQVNGERYEARVD